MEQAAKHERFEGERTLMRIHIGESDRWHGKALYEAIVELLRAREIQRRDGAARRGRIRLVEHLPHGKSSAALAGPAHRDRGGGIHRAHRSDPAAAR